MAEQTIQPTSGVSWLHDTLLKITEARSEKLMRGIANGVPDHEYKQMVGRFRENERLLKVTIPELFTDFYQADDDGEETGELEELKDDG